MDERCKKRGYGLLTSQEVIEQSNLGISMAIQETFGANPQKCIDYIEKLAYIDFSDDPGFIRYTRVFDYFISRFYFLYRVAYFFKWNLVVDAYNRL